MECLFCKIISGEIPSEIVLETPDVLAFLDINPVNPGHTLVVPKLHMTNFLDMDKEIQPAFFDALQNLSLKVKSATGASGINIMNNSEASAGQEVFHLHFHIIPRFDNDGLKHWQGSPYKEDEMKQVAEKIRKQ